MITGKILPVMIIVTIMALQPFSAYCAETGTEKAGSEPPKAVAMASAAAGAEIYSGTVGAAAQLSPLLSESFQTDLATGSATAGIPIVVPPGRKNMQPSLALSYSSNSTNGVCGVGWALSVSSIQRSTKKGVPKYDSTGTFVFASSGSTGELVLIDAAANEYRQKIETAFMKYVFDPANSRWTVWDKSGMKYIFGSTALSRMESDDGTQVFAYYLDRVEDVHGNAVAYIYEKHDRQLYLSRVEYTSNDMVSPSLPADKRIEFIYEDGRPDRAGGFRSGWDIATTKRLKEILVKADGNLAWRYQLGYTQSGDTGRSLLSEITLFDAQGNSLPPKRFTYQTID